MKVLVTGAKGQLGYDVVKELNKRNHEAIGVGSDMMDITDMASVEKIFKETKVDAVVHCAAYTSVDEAEDNKELCMKVNVEGTKNIAKACKKIDAKMIYISTDYVFDGEGEKPWEPEDECAPLNVYGRSKYEGELAVEKYLDKYFIVRIAWVFGINGKNFVKTMLNLGETKDEINVVNDQFGSPTYTYDLSRLLVDMLETEKYGKYHATNEGVCTWYEFAKEIFRQANMRVNVNPVTSDMFCARAKRPHNSKMAKGKLDEQGFIRLPDWRDALTRYLKNQKNDICVVE